MIYIINNGGSYEDNAVFFVQVPQTYLRPEWTKTVERLLLTEWYAQGYTPEILGTTQEIHWRRNTELQAFTAFIRPNMFLGYDEKATMGEDYVGPMQLPKGIEGTTRTVWAKALPPADRVPAALMHLLIQDWGRDSEDSFNRPYLPVLEVMLKERFFKAA